MHGISSSGHLSSSARLQLRSLQSQLRPLGPIGKIPRAVCNKHADDWDPSSSSLCDHARRQRGGWVTVLSDRRDSLTLLPKATTEVTDPSRTMDCACQTHDKACPPSPTLSCPVILFPLIALLLETLFSAVDKGRGSSFNLRLSLALPTSQPYCPVCHHVRSSPNIGAV